MAHSKVFVIISRSISQNLRIFSRITRQLSRYGMLITMVSFAEKFEAKLNFEYPIQFSIGLIDSLELFAGIIMFADSKAEDKIRCKIMLLPYFIFSPL
jgi:hypothetical protein